MLSVYYWQPAENALIFAEGHALPSDDDKQLSIAQENHYSSTISRLGLKDTIDYLIS